MNGCLRPSNGACGSTLRPTAAALAGPFPLEPHVDAHPGPNSDRSRDRRSPASQPPDPRSSPPGLGAPRASPTGIVSTVAQSLYQAARSGSRALAQSARIVPYEYARKLAPNVSTITDGRSPPSAPRTGRRLNRQGAPVHSVALTPSRWFVHAFPQMGKKQYRPPDPILWIQLFRSCCPDPHLTIHSLPCIP
jgi:hypothetical protein